MAQCAHLRDLRVGDFLGGRPRNVQPPLTGGVLDVLAMRTSEEMIRIDAVGHVAGVHDFHAVRHWTMRPVVGEHVRADMSLPPAAVDGKLPVPAAALSARLARRPQPAGWRLLDLRPEASRIVSRHSFAIQCRQQNVTYATLCVYRLFTRHGSVS